MIVKVTLIRNHKKKHKAILEFRDDILFMPNIIETFPLNYYDDIWYSYRKLRKLVKEKLALPMPKYKTLQWFIDITDPELNHYSTFVLKSVDEEDS